MKKYIINGLIENEAIIFTGKDAKQLLFLAQIGAGVIKVTAFWGFCKISKKILETVVERHHKRVNNQESEEEA